MPEVVLLSQYELPYSNIGSWTSMYNYYLTTKHNIDYLICPKPDKRSATTKYSIIKDKSILHRSKLRVLNKRYGAHIDALEAIIVPDQKYVIQLIDNFGIVQEVHKFLNDKFNRSNFYIQFFYHGFPPFYNNSKAKIFFEHIDEMVLLTNDSYKKHIEYYTALPCRFSVLHNGIDRIRFKPLTAKKKEQIKSTFDAKDTIIFLWCSQDRPKKGLDLILDVWKRIYKKHQNIELWVIGAHRSAINDGVKFFGKIPHSEIHKYYQAASVYLFSALNQEGFGLSLLEAMACGNLCIASKNGGIPEVLNYGSYGVLIERPNFIDEWVQTIDKILSNNELESLVRKMEIPKDLYDIKTWCLELNNIIENAKINLS